MKRIVLIENPCKIRILNDQLVLEVWDVGDRTVPLEDLGLLMIETQQSTITSAALSRLARENVPVVVCGLDHHPTGILSSIASGTTHTEVLRWQVEARLPLRKQLWSETVKAKLMNQAATLTSWGHDGAGMREIARKVRSGDPSNCEARGAVRYWKRFSPTDRFFIRDPEGDPPNNLLNYGYAVLRAAMTRAVTGSGLHPALGIHHRNKYNPFCLADDLLEPYRPFIDLLVRAAAIADPTCPMSKENKKTLVGVLQVDVNFNDEWWPLQQALARTASSYVASIRERKVLVKFPSIACE